MYSDLVADLSIGVWRQTVGGPADKERPCRLSPLEMVNTHGSSISQGNTVPTQTRIG